VGGAVGVGLGLTVAVGTTRALSRLEPAAVRRHQERLAAELPTALDLLAACLAAGRGPVEALQAVTDAVGGPVAAELSTVSTRLALGADPLPVWEGLTVHPLLAPLGRTMVRALETGAPVADGIFRLVDDQRRNRRWDAEQRARSVGVQAAAPLALCFLPAFIAVGIVPTIAGAFAQLIP
jgi:pilus assembly protein TadC